MDKVCPFVLIQQSLTTNDGTPQPSCFGERCWAYVVVDRQDGNFCSTLTQGLPRYYKGCRLFGDLPQEDAK